MRTKVRRKLMFEGRLMESGLQGDIHWLLRIILDNQHCVYFTNMMRKRWICSLFFLAICFHWAPHAPLGPSFHPLSTKAGVSWENVVNSGPKNNPLETPPPFHLQWDHFDQDLWLLARDNMQSFLYAKYLGKVLPLDQAKLNLADAWRDLGAFTVDDL